MKPRWAIVSAILVWLIPFVVSILLSRVRQSDRIFFETIMPVVLTATAVTFSVLRRTGPSTALNGLVLGCIWFVVCIGMDLMMFTRGPMAMSFVDYMKDIGLAYLIFPPITAGAGWLIQRERKARAVAA